MKKLKVKRELNDEEKYWLIKHFKESRSIQLKNKIVKSKFFLDQVKSLRVVEECDCKNCKKNLNHAVSFVKSPTHSREVTCTNDVIEYKPNLSRNFIITIDDNKGKILMLEII